MGEALEPLEFNRDGQGYADELARINENIAFAEQRAEDMPNSRTAHEWVASVYMTRARLTGSYDDYAAAEAAIDRAFEVSPAGTGPVLTRASLNFTLHRNDLVEPDLDAVDDWVLVDNPTRAFVESLRGALAFERGQYDLAKEHFDLALELDVTPSTVARLARWHWRHGDFDEAEALYLQADDMYVDGSLEPKAWTHLQLGIMDLERGRYMDAFEHYADGAEILGGWWLLEEHIAEIAVLTGRRQQALDLYVEIIDNTGKGEFMDARASLLLEADEDDAEAASLIAEAGAVFADQLDRFPEAAYFHALGHYQEFGPAQVALELAEANHALRPGVVAKIALAEVRLGLDDVAGAQAVIDEALATSWVSADLFWVGAQVYDAVGDADRAAGLQADAEALHPTIAVD